MPHLRYDSYLGWLCGLIDAWGRWCAPIGRGDTVAEAFANWRRYFQR